STYQKVADLLVQDAVVAVKARISNRDGDIQLNTQDVTPVDTRGVDDRPVAITIAEERCTQENMTRLRHLLGNYPGNTPVHVLVKRPGVTVVVKLPTSFNVQSGPALAADISVLLGTRALQ
ncbi:hypothetical protein OEZ77_27155, partial [Leclercia adecarboxylata]|uniref:hypothetical protein n=1 Tax=Leclercia adecarboxylata TaxID=83655 RepID=UPI00234E0079